ncbi:hypothetical protein EPYR_03876 [Erwinia pyrifoliae DSM 12163]|nr:cellulose biosynthesis protein BcsO [Erwinia pyrifoliae]CAY76256.1 hypothetical protein EPYR_03876 [Erwinia pyrifoliae DSM 12163]
MSYCRCCVTFVPNFLPWAIILMKSYDDLQRFKEKTQTKTIDFKDMSEHFFNAKNSPWRLIKQLADEGAGSILDDIPRIDVPQAVGPAAFTACPVSEKPLQPFSSRPFTAAAPGASDKVGATLLDSIAASLPSTEAASLAVQQAVEVEVNEDAPAAPPAAVSGLTLLQQLGTVQSPPPAADNSPTIPSASAAAWPEIAAARIIPGSSQLFRSPAASPPGALSKDTLLSPLLEKIASCR